MSTMIATGDYTRETKEAIGWLKEHGATVEDCHGVSVITLSPNLDVDAGAHSWQHIVSDAGDDYVEVQLSVDVNETLLSLCKQ